MQLTDEGLALINRAVEKHVENERQILSGVSAESLAELDRRLKELLGALEGGER
ncbi:hypothetical protein D3C75_1262550 [compost metagenome]